MWFHDKLFEFGIFEDSQIWPSEMGAQTYSMQFEANRLVAKFYFD